MALRKCLLDTNVLLRGLDRRHPQCQAARRAVIALRRHGVEVFLTSQNVAEFWAVATRPVDVNGLGMSPGWAGVQLAKMRRFFGIVTETDQSYAKWEQLVAEHGVCGKNVHDSRLVSMMIAHGVSHLLTFKTGDFTRYPEITALHPDELGRGVRRRQQRRAQ